MAAAAPPAPATPRAPRPSTGARKAWPAVAVAMAVAATPPPMIELGSTPAQLAAQLASHPSRFIYRYITSLHAIHINIPQCPHRNWRSSWHPWLPQVCRCQLFYRNRRSRCRSMDIQQWSYRRFSYLSFNQSSRYLNVRSLMEILYKNMKLIKIEKR